MKLIQCIPRGIKCDNPDCDYRDMSVRYEDYPFYINKPCPKCGADLLTQECFDRTVRHVQRAEKLNAFLSTALPQKNGRETDEKQGMKTVVADVDEHGYITGIR